MQSPYPVQVSHGQHDHGSGYGRTCSWLLPLVITIQCVLAVSCSSSKHPDSPGYRKPDDEIGQLDVFWDKKLTHAERALCAQALRRYLEAWEADYKRKAPAGYVYVWQGSLLPTEEPEVGPGGGALAGWSRFPRIDLAADAFGVENCAPALYHELVHHASELPFHPGAPFEWSAVDARQQVLIHEVLAQR